MIKKILSLVIIISFALTGVAQNKSVSGKVLDSKGNALTGANVYWEETWSGTSTNDQGIFKLNKDDEEENLIISYVGFLNDTIRNASGNIEVKLIQLSELEGVEISARELGNHIASIDGIKTGVITSIELTKSSCCDLASCFETDASVQNSVTDIVTNAMELRLLGLAGVYNQLLVDGIPFINGVAYTYGLNSIPGVFVERITVSKGANSVLQGSESLTGQINVLTLDPSTSDKLMVNVFTNSHLEKQLNVSYSAGTKNFNNTLMLHTTQPGNRFDHDDDNFLDMPILSRYSITDKFLIGDPDKVGLNSLVMIRYLDESRIGGQMDYDNETLGSSSIYGQSVKIQQPMYYSKTNYHFDNKNRLSLYTYSLLHNQESWFGTTHYDAQQWSSWANMEYEYIYGNHFFKSGLTWKQHIATEEIRFIENPNNKGYDGIYERDESVYGAYVENTLFSKDKRRSLLTGVRADYHNEYNWLFTPRMVARYGVAKNTDLQLSVGSGWRTAWVFAENVNLLASSRNIIFEDELEAEKSINAGINVTHKISTEKLHLTLSADFYHTRFSNQIFPDYSQDPQKAIISNFKGNSQSNGVQIESNWILFEQIEAKLAYNYLDVFRVEDGEKRELEFNPRHKVTSSISYVPKNMKNWQFDVNAHWLGRQQLPDTRQNPEDYQMALQSDPYTMLNGQIRYKYASFAIYGGCENILGFRQERPILGWQDPFGAYFDTSLAWGPTKGRTYYLGITWKI